MANRAAAKADTRQRITAATLDVYPTTPYPDIRIEDIAQRAGVTGQTVIRHFGGKAGPPTSSGSTVPSTGTWTLR